VGIPRSLPVSKPSRHDGSKIRGFGIRSPGGPRKHQVTALLIGDDQDQAILWPPFVLDCRLWRRRCGLCGKTERVSGGVDQDPESCGVGLDGRGDGAQREQPLISVIEIVDGDVQVRAESLVVRPLARTVVGDVLEVQACCAVAREHDEVLVGCGELPAENVAVELG
jgi:hypothetical protein